MNPKNKTERAAISRRLMLRSALGGLGVAAFGPRANALALAKALRPQASGAPQKFLVVVELDGGNDGLNMVVPHTLPNYALRRPTIALSSGETLAINTGPYATAELRLHGAMPNVAQMYRDGEVGIVSKVGYPSISGSHAGAKSAWFTGLGNGGAFSRGWIARYKDAFGPDFISAVGVARGAHPTLAGGASKPLALASLNQMKFDTDTAFRTNHDHRLDIVRGFLAAQQESPARGALQTAHDLTAQMEDAVANYIGTGTYGTAKISMALRDIAMMMQADFPTRVFYTGFGGGFDTHAAQGKLTGPQAENLQELDEALHGFADDCKAMGIWNNCVIAVVSEFGRRNFENGSGGTDHGKANVVLLLGGAIRGGLHGELPSDEDLAEASLPYAIDFRAIYSEILTRHLGVQNPSSVFTESFQSPASVNLFS